jgi:hypothetical protein
MRLVFLRRTAHNQYPFWFTKETGFFLKLWLVGQHHTRDEVVYACVSCSL